MEENMEIEKIIEYLDLIDNATIDYTTARQKGLSDDEAGLLASKAVTQAVNILSNQLCEVLQLISN